MFCSVEMTTDQDLPVGQSAVAAAFAVRGVDVSPNQDRGVVKVSSSASPSLKSCHRSGYAWVFSAVRWTLLPAGCEAAGGQWRKADDRRQSYCPLHREAAEREEVRLQPRSQGTVLLPCGQRWVAATEPRVSFLHNYIKYTFRQRERERQRDV